MSRLTPRPRAPSLRVVTPAGDPSNEVEGGEHGYDEQVVVSSRLRSVPSLQPVTEHRDSRAPRPRVCALDDSQILAGLRQGDEAAATAFHDRVRPQVDRTLCRLLGRNDPDHHDLAQFALIELVYGIERYRGECSLDAWASTITAHVVYNHLRRRRLERRIFAPPPEETLHPAGHDVGRQALARGMVSRVREHLAHIESNKAWAFLLHDVCGYDLKEMAQIMDVSVAAAQKRLVRGRNELHVRIAQDPELAEWMDGLHGEEP